jgi:hypothetical protein
MKNMYLAVLAYVIVHITMLPVVLYRLLFKVRSRQAFKDYMFAIAIGLDQLGGSYLYGKPDWTVSSYTHYLTCKGNMRAYRFRQFIDFFFGKNHCRDSYINEVATHRKDLDEVQATKQDG